MTEISNLSPDLMGIGQVICAEAQPCRSGEGADGVFSDFLDLALELVGAQGSGEADIEGAGQQAHGKSGEQDAESQERTADVPGQNVYLLGSSGLAQEALINSVVVERISDPVSVMVANAVGNSPSAAPATESKVSVPITTGAQAHDSGLKLGLEKTSSSQNDAPVSDVPATGSKAVPAYVQKPESVLSQSIQPAAQTLNGNSQNEVLSNTEPARGTSVSLLAQEQEQQADLPQPLTREVKSDANAGVQQRGATVEGRTERTAVPAASSEARKAYGPVVVETPVSQTGDTTVKISEPEKTAGPVVAERPAPQMDRSSDNGLRGFGTQRAYGLLGADGAVRPVNASEETGRSFAENPGQGFQFSDGVEEPVKAAKTGKVVSDAASSQRGHSDVPVIHNGHAATGRAEVVTPASAVHAQPAREISTRVINQIVRTAKTHIFDGGAGMTLRLDPPHLGVVNMSVVASQGTVMAVLQTSSESARQILEADIASLRQALTDSGINVDAINVSVGTGSDQGWNLHGERGGMGNGHGYGRTNAPWSFSADDGQGDLQTLNSTLQPSGYGFDYLA